MQALAKIRTVSQAKSKPEIREDGGDRAAKIAELKRALDDAQAEYDLECSILRDEILSRMRQEGATNAVLSFAGGELRVTRANQWKPLAHDSKEELTTTLGSYFARLFREERKAEILPAKLEELLAMLGEMAKDFIRLTESIKPAKDYYEQVSSLALSEQQRATLLEVERISEWTPKVTISHK